MDFIVNKNARNNIGIDIFIKNVFDLVKIKIKNRALKYREDDRLMLIETIQNTVREREYVNTLFEMASEKDLVDYCAYSLMAIEAKYNYYLKIAKDNNIKIDSYILLPAVIEK
jgi:hypothetical protein